jgi:hypothetical protein
MCKRHGMLRKKEFKESKENLNLFLEGEQGTPGDWRVITRMGDANIERRIRIILDPNRSLILNAKREDPNLTVPYARLTED